MSNATDQGKPKGPAQSPNCRGCTSDCACPDRCEGVTGRWCDSCAVHLLAQYVEASELATEANETYVPSNDERDLLVALRDLLLSHPHLVVHAFSAARANKRYSAIVAARAEKAVA